MINSTHKKSHILQIKIRNLNSVIESYDYNIHSQMSFILLEGFKNKTNTISIKSLYNDYYKFTYFRNILKKIMRGICH